MAAARWSVELLHSLWIARRRSRWDESESGCEPSRERDEERVESYCREVLRRAETDERVGSRDPGGDAAGAIIPASAPAP